ncbi:Scd6-like Sm domain-containing protein [Armillaria novae-zelandiae]|uniref:Scd6-like Sm domain-containing protein n=1 Tax=Armillaria novae-zelandiae TaxID=153914 RepID=A0AA39UHF5_9AGAR|nr:Scd6-like Sm domain-containing protein [Armillaria novae-zelandiae]
MASYIGKPISLISQSDVRYRGILAGIDANASTIQLSKVYSMGTESRRTAAEFIPPVQEPYEYIIFRASEVKDLAVDEQQIPRRNVHDDPAVINASSTPTVAGGYSPYPQVAVPSPVYVQPPPPQVVPPTQPDAAPAPPRLQQQNRRANPVHTAAASMETVERALGDLRVSSAGNGNRRRHPQQKEQIKVPTTDFDFESSNARFDKPGVKKGDEEEKDKEPAAYNPEKSFFDSLTPAPVRGGGGGGRGGGRGGHPGRNRREEERERNVATFGEPGGVGLMGPGAYVNGWGGYGRRGGGRPRRGVPPHGVEVNAR